MLETNLNAPKSADKSSVRNVFFGYFWDRINVLIRMMGWVDRIYRPKPFLARPPDAEKAFSIVSSRRKALEDGQSIYYEDLRGLCALFDIAINPVLQGP